MSARRSPTVTTRWERTSRPASSAWMPPCATGRFAAIYRRFIGRTELMWSRQGQEAGDMNAFGLYGSADYQFARRWFAGARYDWSSAPMTRRS